MNIELGSLCASHTNQKDAIHVAVISMKASEMLRPAQRVGIVSDGIAGPSKEIIGIVDPYLTDVVPRGAYFWLCLLPNTVTGMRHEWEHPYFNQNISAAEKWLRDQCDPLGCTFKDLVEDYGDLVTGDYILSSNNEEARDHWYSIQEEFWKQRQIFTGKYIPEDKRGGFTCSC